MATTNDFQRMIGLVLAAVGMLLLVLNAIDYLLGWNQIGSWMSAIGMMLAVIGAGLAHRRGEL
jgi:protein-S-isoprenylcysteine O-methyltransferase Ste14